MNNETPLRCKEIGDAIDIGIGQEVLRFAAEHHPYFWDDGKPPETPNIAIIDSAAFAKAVTIEINREREDGSTLLIDMLDEAIKQAVENGCDGVDHDA